jgi:hypothetical protein
MLRLHVSTTNKLADKGNNRNALESEIKLTKLAISTRMVRIKKLEEHEAEAKRKDAEIIADELRQVKEKEHNSLLLGIPIQKKRGRKRKHVSKVPQKLADMPAERRQRIMDIRKLKRDVTDQTSHIDQLTFDMKSTRNNIALTNYLLEVAPMLNEHHSIKARFQEEEMLINAELTKVEQNATGDHLQAHKKELRAKMINLRQRMCAESNELTSLYINKFRPDMITNDDKTRRYQDAQIKEKQCPECKSDLIHDSVQHAMICSSGCGYSRSHYIANTTSHMSYDDIRASSVSRKYTYRRINHFRDFVRQVQGKSNVPPAPELTKLLRHEFFKCHTKVDDIHPKLVRKKLKKLNKSEHYEIVVVLTMVLNPKFTPISIPPEREEKLCFMFLQAEPVYEKIKSRVRKSRRNFMSYPVAAFKLCQLNGWSEYLHAFTLLKSDKLLVEQDKYWKLICSELNWKYISTVGNVLTSSMFGVKLDVDPDPLEQDITAAAKEKQESVEEMDSDDEYCMRPFEQEEFAELDDDGDSYSDVDWEDPEYGRGGHCSDEGAQESEW